MMTSYTGTGFTHNIPSSYYDKKTREEILDKYDNTTYTSDMTGVCVKVVDGDTIDFKGASNTIIRVRLVGVNTPESSQKGYNASKNFVSKLILNKNISLKIDSKKEKDNYDRTLAIVIIDNKNLNEMLLKEGLAEVMYIPPSEFNPNTWIQDDIINENIPEQKTDTIGLRSTIIHQKKKLFFFVEQSKDLVWPDSEYKYQAYVKNISGQDIHNLRIYIANPREVVIQDRTSSLYAIPTLKNGQSVLINVEKVKIAKEGYYYVNFVATADESEIKTQTLMIKCGYENDNKKTLHRIAFYNFSPYEDAYMLRASDFSDTVAQLTKIQTKPFEAYNQPFETNNLELDLYAQDMFLTNTDEMPSMYLGRENWESNVEESYTGETLSQLIKQINEESDLVDIDFLRVGSNEMDTDFQRIYPNGFIHRFGLLKSEFYKMLGIIPKIYSLNDDLFRWARSSNEPVIYPIRENDKWNQKPWCGTGYYVYERVENEDGSVFRHEKAIFTKEDDAEAFVDNLNAFNKFHFQNNITYIIHKREWLPGIFYVEIPLKDIPSNFLLPTVSEIQAVIELCKPYGLKGYPRFGVDGTFNHKSYFSSIPTLIPHVKMDLDEHLPINYYIEQKKYMNTEDGIKLTNYGNQAVYINQYINNPTIYSHNPKINICKTLDIDIKYFIQNNMIYLHVYPLNSFINPDIDTIQISPQELSQILQNATDIDGVYLNYGITGQKLYTTRQVLNQNIFTNDILLVVKKVDNSINIDDAVKTDIEEENIYEPYHDFEYQILCNDTSKDNNSFDGTRKSSKLIASDLNQLLKKNAEDICFYLDGVHHFMPEINLNEYYNLSSDKQVTSGIQDRTSEIRPIIKLSRQYKTLNYFDENAGHDYYISYKANNQSAYQAIRVAKTAELPLNASMNTIFYNTDDTKKHIISYKHLYDNIYKISYTTYKHTEVIIKEIVTDFNFLLFEIIEDSDKDLIKVYYASNGKTIFFTAFNAKIIRDDNNDYGFYKVRFSLTSDVALDKDVILGLSSVYLGDLLFDTTQNKYPDWYLTNKLYSTLLSTDYYKPSEIIKSTKHWKNLYKINKDSSTFATFENTDEEETAVNGIQLYLDDINIPQNSIVDKIYVDIYSHAREDVQLSSEYQINTNLYNETDNISSIFNIDDYQIYSSLEHNSKYLYNQLAINIERENESQIKYYKNLIDIHNKKNQGIDISFNDENPLRIKDSYWNEVSFAESMKSLKTSNVKQVYLILEGYNYSNDVNIKAQLAYYDEAGNISQDINIDMGYFYKKVPIQYNAKYNIENLNIRFKFTNVSQIDLYKVKAEVSFTHPQQANNNFLNEGNSIQLQGISRQICDIANNLDGDSVKNGLMINLLFDNIKNDIKVYSIIVNIIYHEKAFTNIIETATNFNKIDTTSATGVIRGCVFDEHISDMRQEKYTTKKFNGEYDAGFEIDNRIYQAFEATNDNITSIELKPNGKIGTPDNYIKIAILDNYDNLPNNVLKEIIVDVDNAKQFDNEAYKFNIYVDGLQIGNTYWFSIEPLDKTKQGARRFYYSNTQEGNHKLLKVNGGDVINQHASLFFKIYSKANRYPFQSLPYVFSPEVYSYETEYTDSEFNQIQSNRDINYITEIQILDGAIQNLTESLFTNSDCPNCQTDNED